MRKVFLFALSTLALAACGRSHIGRDGTAVIHGRDGSTVTISHAAPTNLPPYLKLYPGAAVKSTLNSGPRGGIVVMQTSAAPDAVVDFYKKQAAAAGLQVEMDSNNADGPHVIMFNQANGKKNFNVSASKEPDGSTNVGLTYNAQG